MNKINFSHSAHLVPFELDSLFLVVEANVEERQ